MKENTKQILKVSICTLVALVLFAGVILMCIYFAFDTTSNGVADAYTDEEVGVNNLSVSTNEGFYLKLFNDNNLSELAYFVDYLCYFIHGLGDSSTYIEQTYDYVGTFRVRYYNSSNVVRSVTTPIHLCIYKDSDDDIINIYAFIEEDSFISIFDLYYDYADNRLEAYTTDFYVQHDLSTDYYSYISITDNPQTSNTAANQIASVFGISTDISSLDLVSFEFVNFANLGCIISTTTTFANPPVVMPEGVYDDNLQDKYTEGYDDGLAHYLPLIQSLQQEKTQLQQQITTLQEEKTTLQNEIITLQEQNTALNNQISDLREHIDDLYSTINILTSDRDSLRQQVSELQNQITSLQQEKTQLQQQITTLQEEKTTLQNEITTLQEQNTVLQNQITELQSELDRYVSYYESIGWFDVLSSSLNNVSLINIDGYKSTYVDVNVADGTNNQVNVWNLDENPGNGTAFAVVLPRYFGNGTRFRFSYRGLIGSASGMADLPAFLGYINSTGNLITIMELPVSSETFVEFNISEEINTFVIYSTGNLIVFEDFKFQIFSFDEIGIYDDGFADGRDEGIKYGETVGYENGYADARDYYMNNDFSFFALFSSVLDAPLQMIIGTDEKPGMLNFYIPGLDINIAPFLLSLFSVALVITIIRFILARAS